MMLSDTFRSGTSIWRREPNLAPNFNHENFQNGHFFDAYVLVHATMLLWCAAAELVPISIAVPSFYVAKKEIQKKNNVHNHKQNFKEEEKGKTPSKILETTREMCRLVG